IHESHFMQSLNVRKRLVDIRGTTSKKQSHLLQILIECPNVLSAGRTRSRLRQRIEFTLHKRPSPYSSGATISKSIPLEPFNFRGVPMPPVLRERHPAGVG